MPQSSIMYQHACMQALKNENDMSETADQLKARFTTNSTVTSESMNAMVDALAVSSTTKETLKSYFETGDKPTQAQFYELIDTIFEQQKAVGTTILPDRTIPMNGSLAVAMNFQTLGFNDANRIIFNGDTYAALFSAIQPTKNNISLSTAGFSNSLSQPFILNYVTIEMTISNVTFSDLAHFQGDLNGMPLTMRFNAYPYATTGIFTRNYTLTAAQFNTIWQQIMIPIQTFQIDMEYVVAISVQCYQSTNFTSSVAMTQAVPQNYGITTMLQALVPAGNQSSIHSFDHPMIVTGNNVYNGTVTFENTMTVVSANVTYL